MAVRTWNDTRLFERALIVSLGLHLLLALFLPAWIPAQSPGLQPVEALSFARVMRIEVRRPQAAAPAVAVPQTQHRAAHISFARSRDELTAKTHRPRVRPTAVNAPVGKTAAAPVAVRLHRQAPLYARAPAKAMPVSSSVSTAAATPAPQATVQTHDVAGAGVSDRGGALPFGASQDPVLDPGVLAQLQKIASVHVTLLVTVGEDGHTKHIAFQPPLDAQTEQRIEALLNDANWDAAVCGGGVTCEGVATIKL